MTSAADHTKTCNASDCVVECFLQEIPVYFQLMSSFILLGSITNIIFNDMTPCTVAATLTTTANWLQSPAAIPIGSTEKWKEIQQQDEETRQVIHLIRTCDSPRHQS